jgi:four helix bundle protein
LSDYRTLKVWHKGRRLTQAIYQATAGFPKEELYGLTSQMRRASVSIPSNIAEGCGRGGDAEMARYMRMALGSASELQSALVLARDQQFLQANDYESLSCDVSEVKRMLTGLIRKFAARRADSASRKAGTGQ